MSRRAAFALGMGVGALISAGVPALVRLALREPVLYPTR